MTGQRGLNRDLGGLHIPDLTHHHHIGILTQNGAQPRREGHADLGVHLGLAHALDRILHRVFHGEDVAGLIVQEIEPGIKRGGLARARRTGNQHHTIGLAQHLAEVFKLARRHAQLVQREARAFLVQ